MWTVSEKNLDYNDTDNALIRASLCLAPGVLDFYLPLDKVNVIKKATQAKKALPTVAVSNMLADAAIALKDDIKGLKAILKDAKNIDDIPEPIKHAIGIGTGTVLDKAGISNPSIGDAVLKILQPSFWIAQWVENVLGYQCNPDENPLAWLEEPYKPPVPSEISAIRALLP